MGVKNNQQQGRQIVRAWASMWLGTVNFLPHFPHLMKTPQNKPLF
ncbi:hypothetical protein SCH4B_4485 [Ruegeria sp. TrichCH4B]|nr:hypothetical protein SCH4B_4485 [Ruegeria sp. TrichCH4B]